MECHDVKQRWNETMRNQRVMNRVDFPSVSLIPPPSWEMCHKQMAHPHSLFAVWNLLIHNINFGSCARMYSTISISRLSGWFFPVCLQACICITDTLRQTADICARLPTNLPSFHNGQRWYLWLASRSSFRRLDGYLD